MRGTGIAGENNVISLEIFKELQGWKKRSILRLPSDKSTNDIILGKAGLPPPVLSPPGFPSSLPRLSPPTPGFKVQPRGVREPEPDAALSRAPAHAPAHAARHVRGGGAGARRHQLPA